MLTYLLHPDKEHDFDSVNRYVPDIDDTAGIRNAYKDPIFYKSHALRHSQGVIFLHRHVGDVLISQWWYKRKFHKDERTLEEYMEQDDYGTDWRKHINHYFPCHRQIGYEELSDPDAIESIVPKFSSWSIKRALARCTFERMQALEERGFGAYPSGDPEIKFCRSGKSRQWLDLRENLQTIIIEKNLRELVMLGYA